MDAAGFPASNAPAALDLLTRFDSVFDVLKPDAPTGGPSDEEIDSKVAARNQAKKSKDFKLADQLRQELLDLGIILEDTKEGVRWKRK